MQKPTQKRRLAAIAIALAVTFTITAMWSAATIQREGDPDANVMEDSGSLAGDSADNSGAAEKKKDGNKVARFFTAPFRAFGKLFGHKDRFQRMSEKDSEKFESVGVMRVDQNRDRDAVNLKSGTAKEHLANGRKLLADGQLNEAIAELSTAASIDPKLAEAHNLLGVAFSQKGMTERAKDSYDRAVKAEPEDAQTLNNLGFSLYQNGNYRAAADRLKRAAKLAPHDERILNNLGLALCRLGKFDEAYKNFARAGGEYNGNLNIARMLERFGRDEDAIKYYEGARRVDPRSSFALRRLADLYQRIGMTQESQNARTALASISTEANVALIGK
ncbi:MAG: tetratricopeptide repeat protein [bacterium]